MYNKVENKEILLGLLKRFQKNLFNDMFAYRYIVLSLFFIANSNPTYSQKKVNLFPFLDTISYFNNLKDYAGIIYYKPNIVNLSISKMKKSTLVFIENKNQRTKVSNILKSRSKPFYLVNIEIKKKSGDSIIVYYEILHTTYNMFNGSLNFTNEKRPKVLGLLINSGDQLLIYNRKTKQYDYLASNAGKT